jgi:hypothetical protein
MEPNTQDEAPRQLPLALDATMLRGLTATQRAKAVALLARLLLEAAGHVVREPDDEHV